MSDRAAPALVFPAAAALCRFPAGGVMAAVLLMTSATAAPVAEPGPAPALRLLKSQCFSCHHAEKRKGGLDLGSRESILAGGDSGPALVPGRPEESPLILSLAADADPHMPPKKQLNAEQMALLDAWVRQGAVWDAAALSAEPAGTAPPLRPVHPAALPAAYHPVMVLALSPDGTRLAAGCGNEVLIFENGPSSLTLRTKAHAHLDTVLSAAWTPDGTRLVTGAFRRAVVWRTDGPILSQQRETISGLAGGIGALVIPPGGTRVLLADGAAAENGILREMDLASGRITRSWPAHADTISAMALSPDGRRLATAGSDGLVKLWDPDKGSAAAQLEAHAAQALAVAFSPDGSRLVTGGADRLLKIWDAETRGNLITLPVKESAWHAAQWLRSGPEDAGGTVFAAQENGTISRYTDFKTHTGEQSSETAKERPAGNAGTVVYSLAASPDGTRLFAGTRTGLILGWDREGKATDRIDTARATVQPWQAPAPPDAVPVSTP